MESEKQIPSHGVLEKIMESLVEEKVFGIHRAKSANYDKTEKEIISISNSIRCKLGSEQSLFILYEELSSINENASLRDAYKQGFTDGISLLKEILLKT